MSGVVAVTAQSGFLLVTMYALHILKQRPNVTNGLIPFGRTKKKIGTIGDLGELR